ncbi:hypothetical protein [Floridanema aerugineum]|uniref:Uncharacterized protein n=1 Tax=Floridaenema aerugineum BLCC-F46 TaxID=3153654 RepID=A0ABV4X6Y6_9CYAN
MLLQHRLNEIQSVVSGYQAQIDELNAKISALQAHAQKVGSVEAAMESAVQQLQTAIAMVNQVCPDELPEFKDVINSQFGDAPIAELPAANETTDSIEPTEPTAPTASTKPSGCDVYSDWESADKAIAAMKPNEVIDPTKGVIDVEPTEAAEPTESPAPSPEQKPPYHALSWREFLSYAKAQGVNTKGKTRAEIELELLSQSNK